VLKHVGVGTWHKFFFSCFIVLCSVQFIG